jgi:hypothetical protein
MRPKKKPFTALARCEEPSDTELYLRAYFSSGGSISLTAETRNVSRAASSPANLRLLSRRRRWAGRSPVLKTLPAIDGAPLGGLERYCRFLRALRADRLRLHSLGRACGSASPRRPVCLARFTPLGLVFETLVGEKHLLARSKNKLGRVWQRNSPRQTKWKVPFYRHSSDLA